MNTLKTTFLLTCLTLLADRERERYEQTAEEALSCP